MKYLLVLLVVVVAFHVWRNNRRKEMPPPSPRKNLPLPEAMMRCTYCGTHIPGSDAVLGRDARPYCCAEHRAQDHP